MSFFNKLKQGVSDAGQKAKISVEVTRLKMQIQAKQNTVKEKCSFIGSIIYTAYEKGEQPFINQDIAETCKEISQIQDEIKLIQSKIYELNGEKNCEVCNQIMPFDSKFCQSCGNKVHLQQLGKTTEQTMLIDLAMESPGVNVQEETTNSPDDGEQQADSLCPSCQKFIEPTHKFCGSCGHVITQ
jgi:RNA polymerase subunit RPABC4/transcription elongation factor Spt4